MQKLLWNEARRDWITPRSYTFGEFIIGTEFWLMNQSILTFPVALTKEKLYSRFLVVNFTRKMTLLLWLHRLSTSWNPTNLVCVLFFLRIEGSFCWWLGPLKPQQWYKINGNFIHIKGKDSRRKFQRVQIWCVCSLFSKRKKWEEKRGVFWVLTCLDSPVEEQMRLCLHSLYRYDHAAAYNDPNFDSKNVGTSLCFPLPISSSFSSERMAELESRKSVSLSL